MNYWKIPPIHRIHGYIAGWATGAGLLRVRYADTLIMTSRNQSHAKEPPIRRTVGFNKHLLKLPCRLKFWGCALAPRSADSNVCDLFLWGYFKSARVYESKPRTLDDLRDTIRAEILRINEELLQRVRSNFLDPLASCCEEDGRDMPDVIFKIWH